MKGKEECAFTEPRYGLKECFPKRSRGSLTGVLEFAARFCKMSMLTVQ